MAAKTPNIIKTVAGYVDPKLGVFGGVNPIATSLDAVGTNRGNRNGLTLSIYHFDSVSNIDDTDTWASGIKNVVACAWQANQVDTDIVAVTLTDAAAGTFTFDAQNANSEGWLWILHGS